MTTTVELMSYFTVTTNDYKSEVYKLFDYVTKQCYNHFRLASYVQKCESSGGLPNDVQLFDIFSQQIALIIQVINLPKSLVVQVIDGPQSLINQVIDWPKSLVI